MGLKTRTQFKGEMNESELNDKKRIEIIRLSYRVFVVCLSI